MDSIGVFEVATSGADEQRLVKQAQADKLAAAVYDVRERHGQWLFGASDLDGFNDRAKLAFVSICETIEPHMHARTGVYRRVMKAMEKEWRERRAVSGPETPLTPSTQPGAPVSSPVPTRAVETPVEIGGPFGAGAEAPLSPPLGATARRHQACYPGCHENEAHAKKFHKDDKKESRRQAGKPVHEDPDRAHRVLDHAHELVDQRSQPTADPYDDDAAFRPGHEPDYGQQAQDFARSQRMQDHNREWQDAYHAEQAGEDPHAGDPINDLMDTPLGQHFQEEGPSFGRPVATRRRAEFETEHNHPELHTQETFQDHQGEELIPEGNFDAYKDSVDQGAPSKVDHDFVHGGGEVRQHDESGDHNFVPTVTGGRRQPRRANLYGCFAEYTRIAQMIQATGDPSAAPPGNGAETQGLSPNPSLGGVGGDAGPGAGMGAPPADAGAAAPAPTSSTPAGSGAPVTPPMAPMTASRSEYQLISAMAKGSSWAEKAIRESGTRQARVRLLEVANNAGLVSPVDYKRISRALRNKMADRNYLQQADEALTKVLNEKAEEFQNTIAPLQQALITIQQAEQLTNPLNVSPPAGTVNVLPQGAQGNQAPQGQGGLGADPAAAGLAAGAGGAAPPPAPAPDPTQQMQARRKRGGQGKGEARQAGHGAGGLEPWPSERHENWMAQNPDAYPEESPYYSGPEYSSHGRPEEQLGAGEPGGRWHRADVVQDFNKWVTKAPGLPTGGEADVDQFAQQKKKGPRAINKLKHQQGIDFNGAPSAAPALPKAPASSPGGASNYGIKAKNRKRAQKPLIAEPDYVWSKSPSTVHVEFANRMAKGSGPDDVYRQLIAEITDHHSKGHIDNRDAHRAANEAFGRLLMSRRKAGRRKQAWSGWGPDVAPKRHKVADWEWDNHLNGFVSTAHRKFQCSCGVPVNVPDYHNCRCGKIWNTYVIGTGGDKHQAAAEKFVAREVPVRDNVLVANRKNRKQALDHFHDDSGRYTGPMKPKVNAYPPDPYGGADNCPECDLHFTQGHDPGVEHANPHFSTRRRAGYGELSDAFDNAQETENAFPSDHHPATPQGKSTPEDWHHRDVNMRWTS